ncbi:MAG: methyltransferase domain-containing protein [Acetobacterales bacterium]
MASLISELADLARYGLTQTARAGFYMGQSVIAARLAGSQPLPDDAPPPSDLRVADWLKEIRAAFEQDWRNIAAGYYRMPEQLIEPPHRALLRSIAFLRDVPRVAGRRRSEGHSDLPKEAATDLPDYFLRNFHYQTDGYLSRRSARLYDHQVETLFGGTADAMRRQALVPLWEVLHDRDPATVRLLDLGCGTGRLLKAVKENYPAIDATALDLSAPYLEEARSLNDHFRNLRFWQANAEDVPAEDGSFDVVLCAYLLHELPPDARRNVAAEAGRVLRPGGRLIVIDTLQLGDRPELDNALRRFPLRFHEPYYAGYVEEDLAALFDAAGLEHDGDSLSFLSKVSAFDKPGGALFGPKAT